jgi:outer membrane protein OmpA-like peptidoglycan-associated protein/Tol biopolymer transport system component
VYNKNSEIFQVLRVNQPLTFQLYWLAAFFFIAFTVTGQPSKRLQRMFDEARQFHTQQNYDLAIESSLKILEHDSTFVDAHLLLADVYHEKGNTASEIVHLAKAGGYSEMPLIQLRLGNAYFSTGAYEKALDRYQTYLNSGWASPVFQQEVERKLESCLFALEAIKHPVEFEPEQLPNTVNSEYDEYWPSLSIDQQRLVVTRLITSPDKQPQEDFYMSEYSDGNWNEAQPVAEINTPENEGAQALSADGNILFFTACNRPGGAGSCDIYYSVRREGRWSTPVNAGGVVNSAYWEAQPSFSSDGRYLYFSSNRVGGKGMRDIWRAELLGTEQNGRLLWDKPVNLGDSINTPGNETSPFIHAGNRDFYFASDYHTGMGGFDLFLSKLENDSVFSRPRNLGYPINTFNNEQGLHIGADGLTAYFSSARDSLAGLDIYSFHVDESIRPHPATYVKAFVSDAETGKPVKAQIDLLNLATLGENERHEVTDSQGEVLLCLPSGENYAFSVSKEGYLFYSNAFDLRDARQIYNPYELHIELEPVRVGAEMNLYNIYFETDSFRILAESEPELQQLVEFLQTNPALSVEVQGHTDDTGSPERNMDLSEKRARSVVDYLVEHGVRKGRLQWAGYGENRPVAGNDSEEGRSQNRRTAIKILTDGR